MSQNSITLKQLASWDSSSLSGIVEDWEKYDNKSILLINAELNRREYLLTEKTKQRIQAFCTLNKASNIEPFITAYLKGIGYNNYNEYYEKVVSIQNYIIPENPDSFSKTKNMNNDKYPALRTISTIYKIFALVIGVISVLLSISVAFFMGQVSNGIFYGLTTFGIGALITLGLVAVSEAIMVFIDIEYNTRNKREE